MERRTCASLISVARGNYTQFVYVQWFSLSRLLFVTHLVESGESRLKCTIFTCTTVYVAKFTKYKKQCCIYRKFCSSVLTGIALKLKTLCFYSNQRWVLLLYYIKVTCLPSFSFARDSKSHLQVLILLTVCNCYACLNFQWTTKVQEPLT